MKDTDKIQKFIELRAKNWSYQRIADEINVSKPTLIKWGQEYRYEISNHHQMELEALYEEHKLSLEQRIEYLGCIHKKVLEELNKRDLTDVKTDKLLEMLLTTTDKLENVQKFYSPTLRTEEEIQKEKSHDTYLESIRLTSSF